MVNQIGDLGESMFETDLRRHLQSHGFLFRPRHLGEKWPLVDYLVELQGVDGMNPFFLVQVKATNNGYSADRSRLKTTSISESYIQRMASSLVPVYVAGVDTQNDSIYLLAITGNTIRALPSCPTDHLLNKQRKLDLYDEVLAFWREQSPVAFSSSFITPTWT